MGNNTAFTSTILREETVDFESLVSIHKDRVYGLAISFLNDFDAAYDASQEVFLPAFLKLHLRSYFLVNEHYR